MPAVSEIQVAPAGQMGVAVEGSSWGWPGPPVEPVLPALDVFNQQRRYIDVFNRGRASFDFSATASAPWLILSQSKGTINKERPVRASVDWHKVPQVSINAQ